MEILDSLAPLIFFAPPAKLDAEGVAQMDALYRRLWLRREKYALVTLPQPAGSSLAPRDRKFIGEWANQEHVQANSKRYCVRASVVSPSALERGAMTALLWVWKPAVKLSYFADVAGAVDDALDGLEDAGIALPCTRQELRNKALDLVAQRSPRAR